MCVDKIIDGQVEVEIEMGLYREYILHFFKFDRRIQFVL